MIPTWIVEGHSDSSQVSMHPHASGYQVHWLTVEEAQSLARQLLSETHILRPGAPDLVLDLVKDLADSLRHFSSLQYLTVKQDARGDFMYRRAVVALQRAEDLLGKVKE